MEDATTRLMVRAKHEVEVLLRSGTTYIESRSYVLGQLADGQLHLSSELIDSFEPDCSGQKLSFPLGTDPNISGLVSSLARRAAVIEAIGLLYADGIVVQVNSKDVPASGVNTNGEIDSLYQHFQISWTSGSGSSSGPGRFYMPLPRCPGRVRITRPVKLNGSTLDFVTFSHDLGPLGLDQRTLRALEQSFQAFRGGLYLATALLCGTVLEGAVRTSAPRLAALATSEQRPKLSHQHLRTIVKQLIHILRLSSERELPARADQLSSHINRFIDLRNYGAHTGEPDAGLERWFDDDLQGAMLLADLRHTLLMLKEAIDDRLAISS